ncbi:PhzF family phenazine biosynthesis protein [Pseudorhodobacter sp.]|uniref:PhzF family phenazine biosynthesis protein n=1 Tax=Pseudorhodobacter sp. TaxID=1934400 RepID=UPI0026476EC2|nr:PhzF family phenazine biosynthesis protein [Pseudorhodobacter sp.]MDN5787004.1 PhzF family phenazine biosynthesis protein [Pseudorhodobacter sp.]
MLKFHTMDVFTETAYLGNPLAIVLGADALGTDQMQTIAREFNLSETIFVQRPKNLAHTAKVRIFLPTAEIPFAGHPTIGCAILLAEAAMGDGDSECQIVLEEEAGVVPVHVRRQSGRITAELTAPVVPFRHDGPQNPRALSPDLLALALCLRSDEIGLPDHKPGLWQGGSAFLYVPLRDLGALKSARPAEPYWSEVLQAGGVTSAYLYTIGAAGVDYQARMISAKNSFSEDPATGSASAILAAQLWASGAVGQGETWLSLLQGVEMGRRSEIGLTIRCNASGVQEVRVRGSAVRISDGQIRVPATT